MTPEQYFDGDCCLTKYYQKAYDLKRKETNQQLWLQGLYIYEALIDASPLFRVFSSGTVKPEPYVSEPYPLTVAERREKEERDAKAKQDTMIAYMETLMAKSKKAEEAKRRG